MLVFHVFQYFPFKVWCSSEILWEAQVGNFLGLLAITSKGYQTIVRSFIDSPGAESANKTDNEFFTKGGQ